MSMHVHIAYFQETTQTSAEISVPTTRAPDLIEAEPPAPAAVPPRHLAAFRQTKLIDILAKLNHESSPYVLVHD